MYFEGMDTRMQNPFVSPTSGFTETLKSQKVAFIDQLDNPQREIFTWRFVSYILTSVCECILITVMKHWWMYGVEFFWRKMCPVGNCCEHGNGYSGFEMVGSLRNYKYISVAFIVSKAYPSHISYIFPPHFQVYLQNCGKQLLASSCLSVCSFAWNNPTPTGWIFMKFDV